MKIIKRRPLVKRVKYFRHWVDIPHDHNWIGANEDGDLYSYGKDPYAGAGCYLGWGNRSDYYYLGTVDLGKTKWYNSLRWVGEYDAEMIKYAKDAGKGWAE